MKFSKTFLAVLLVAATSVLAAPTPDDGDGGGLFGGLMGMIEKPIDAIVGGISGSSEKNADIADKTAQLQGYQNQINNMQDTVSSQLQQQRFQTDMFDHNMVNRMNNVEVTTGLNSIAINGLDNSLASTRQSLGLDPSPSATAGAGSAGAGATSAGAGAAGAGATTAGAGGAAAASAGPSISQQVAYFVQQANQGVNPNQIIQSLTQQGVDTTQLVGIINQINQNPNQAQAILAQYGSVSAGAGAAGAGAASAGAGAAAPAAGMAAAGGAAAPAYQSTAVASPAYQSAAAASPGAGGMGAGAGMA